VDRTGRQNKKQVCLLVEAKKLQIQAARVAQVVEHLPSKHEASSLNPTAAKRKKNKKQKNSSCKL
jgi:hypothetical protein